MPKKRTISGTILMLVIIWAALIFLWRSVDKGNMPDMNVSIDWATVGSAIIGKVIDVFRDFITPR